jgi:hypothetical protein
MNGYDKDLQACEELLPGNTGLHLSTPSTLTSSTDEVCGQLLTGNKVLDFSIHSTPTASDSAPLCGQLQPGSTNLGPSKLPPARSKSAGVLICGPLLKDNTVSNLSASPSVRLCSAGVLVGGQQLDENKSEPLVHDREVAVNIFPSDQLLPGQLCTDEKAFSQENICSESTAVESVSVKPLQVNPIVPESVRANGILPIKEPDQIIMDTGNMENSTKESVDENFRENDENRTYRTAANHAIKFNDEEEGKNENVSRQKKKSNTDENAEITFAKV